METQQTTEQAQTPVEMTDFQKWASLPESEQVPSSEAENVTASETAPASEPESTEVENDETEENTTEEKPVTKKGLKKRFADLTTKIRDLEARLAAQPAAAAKEETGIATPPKAEAKPDQSGKPVAANFETYEDFVEALTDWKVEQKQKVVAERAAADTRSQTVKTQVEAARAKYADYDQVVTNDVPISGAMAEAMIASDHGADIAYHLGKNKAEAARIAKLTPAQAGVAIARIEASLATKTSTEQPKPAQSKAPKPPAVIKGKGTGTDAEPDPKDFAKWAKWRDRQERAASGD